MIRKKISILIPVYNNDTTLYLLYNRILRTIKSIKDLKYQLIFINDKSTDRSERILNKISSKDKNVTVVHLSKNFGQAAAIYASFEFVKGDYIVCFDADLQDPPELISKVVKQLKLKNDIVVASRRSSRESLFRKIASNITHFFIKKLVKDYPENGFNYWAVTKKMFQLIKSDHDVSKGIQLKIMNLGFKRKTIYYDREKRQFTKSQYSFFKLTNNFVSLIFTSSTTPMRLGFFIAILISLLGLLNVISVFVSYLDEGMPFNGWAPLVFFITFFGSANLFFICIVGEYVIRITNMLESKKFYYIDRVINK
jgi:glycosyltransferase involved in cell wall biosynthesis